MKNIEEQITQQVNNMPKVSEAPYRLLRAMSDENYQTDDIIKIVESDVTLTTQCLKVVNSAAFGLRNKISSIKQAVVLLGGSTIVSIALSQTFSSLFSSPLQGYISEKEEFWSHSNRCALGAKILAKKLVHTVNADLAYTAGLLHDLGKAIISDYLEKFHDDLLQELKIDHHTEFLKMEQRYLGTDHTIVGEKIARKWQFPDPLVFSIRYHHEVEKAPREYQTLVSMIHVSDIMAMMSGMGTGVDSLVYSLDPIALKLLNIQDETQVENILMEIDMEYLSIQKRLNSAITE